MTEITLFDSRTEIGRACGDGVQFMEMPAALSLIVPSDDWLLNEFFPFWCDWKTQLGLPEGGRYQPGSGMCEWISREMLQRLAVCCRKALPGRDVNPAAFEVRLGIPPGFVLNGVTDGGHAPILISLTMKTKLVNGGLWSLSLGRWRTSERRSKTLLLAVAASSLLLTSGCQTDNGEPMRLPRAPVMR